MVAVVADRDRLVYQRMAPLIEDEGWVARLGFLSTELLRMPASLTSGIKRRTLPMNALRHVALDAAWTVLVLRQV